LHKYIWHSYLEGYDNKEIVSESYIFVIYLRACDIPSQHQSRSYQTPVIVIEMGWIIRGNGVIFDEHGIPESFAVISLSLTLYSIRVQSTKVQIFMGAEARCAAASGKLG
jgi:hypothetical protein